MTRAGIHRPAPGSRPLPLGIAVGPGNTLGKPGRPPRQEASSPNQTVASLHSPRRLINSTSNPGPGKCRAKSAAGLSLIAPAGK